MITADHGAQGRIFDVAVPERDKRGWTYLGKWMPQFD
jgi:hypothetical protein